MNKISTLFHSQFSSHSQATFVSNTEIGRCVSQRIQIQTHETEYTERLESVTLGMERQASRMTRTQTHVSKYTEIIILETENRLVTDADA